MRIIEAAQHPPAQAEDGIFGGGNLYLVLTFHRECSPNRLAVILFRVPKNNRGVCGNEGMGPCKPLRRRIGSGRPARGSAAMTKPQPPEYEQAPGQPVLLIVKPGGRRVAQHQTLSCVRTTMRCRTFGDWQNGLRGPIQPAGQYFSA